jgi:hypothetical protein
MAMGKNIMELLFRVKADDAKKDIKEVGDGLNKVGSGGKLAQKGLGFMSNGFKKVGLAMKAAGIGLFVGLLSQLTGLFQSNQKTSDAFSRIMLKLKPIFDAVGKALEFVVGLLEGMIDIVSNVIGSLFGFADASNNAADALVEQRNKVKLLNAELALIQLQYQREAELMRQIRDDESLSIEERIAANFELGKILAEQLEIERNAASQSLRLAEMELALNEENINLQTALIDAKTKLAEIDERITGQRSEQLTNLNSLNREREAQQREANAKRQEQLKAEAEMLQSLIDLQNEDIKVTKEKFRTINEQFDNAEKANQEQIDFLEKKKKEELAALKLSTENAQKNIDIKKEELKQFEDNNAELIKSNQEKADSFEKIAQEELKKQGFRGVEYIKTQEDLITFQDNVNKHIAKEFAKVEDKFGMTVQEMADSYSPLTSLAGNQALSMAEGIQENADKALNNIERLTKTSSEEIISITDEQIEHTEESLNKNLAITDSFKANQQAIIEKYDKQILETQESLIETTETLQEQANNDLFLHFETAKEKEIRETKEKYDKLLGLALNNAEQTKLLEEEKEAALKEIRSREGEQIIQDTINLFERLKLEKEKRDEDKKLDDDKKAEEQAARNQKTIDNAVGMMNALLSLSKTKSEKEKKQLDNDLAKGLITEKQYNKKLQQIEEEQLRKEKQAALIQIGVDTARGISGAVQAGSGLVFPANLAAISTGILAVLAGVAQAAGVLGQTVDVDSSEMPDDNTSDLGGDVPRLPTFGDAVSDTPPVQAFVVETDISNAQALQSELDLQSTL